MNIKGWKAESDRREVKRRQGSWGLASSSLAILLIVSFAPGNCWARDQITGDTSAKVESHRPGLYLCPYSRARSGHSRAHGIEHLSERRCENVLGRLSDDQTKG